MLDGDAFLKNVFAEHDRLEQVYDLEAMRLQVDEKLALEDAQRIRQNAVRELQIDGLDQSQLEALMKLVVSVGGGLTDGHLTQEQFIRILNETNPGVPSTHYNRIFEIFASGNKLLDFKQLAAACVALSGR